MYVIKNYRESLGGYYCGVDYHGEVGHYANFLGGLDSKEVKVYHGYNSANVDLSFLIEIMNISADDIGIVPVKLVEID